MQKKQKCNVVWLRNNLRIQDNEAFYKASKEDLPFFAVYCWDPIWHTKDQFGLKKMGDYRAQFLWQTLQDLKVNLKEKSISLIIKFGSSEAVFSEISQHFDVHKVFYPSVHISEEVRQESEAKTGMNMGVTQWISVEGQTLFNQNDIGNLFQNNIPTLFTDFRKKVEQSLSIRAIFPSIQKQNFNVQMPLKSDEEAIEKLVFFSTKIDSRAVYNFVGGESKGNARVDDYLFENQSIRQYKDTRNELIGKDNSSKFSPWLANGSLSVVAVYHQIKSHENELGENESTYWLFFELLWREYFKWISKQFGNKVFYKNGLFGKENSVINDEKRINDWMNGQTHCDFVNANQKELLKTGWMSNRGRQNVASFFCKTLCQDWRIGAAFFESYLIDYDADSNYCNWLYLAGLGNDARNRTFNTQLQANTYDPLKHYRTLWNSK